MSAVVEHKSLPVHGNLVRYDEAGADSGGPVVVLIHGIASRAAQWNGVMAELGRTCHVIAPDLLGHGESAKPRGDYSLGAHACGIRDLLAALGHDRITLVGHSLGGGAGLGRLLQKAHVPMSAGLVECMVGFASLADPATRSAFIHTCRSVLDI